MVDTSSQGRRAVLRKIGSTAAIGGGVLGGITGGASAHDSPSGTRHDHIQIYELARVEVEYTIHSPQSLWGHNRSQNEGSDYITGSQGETVQGRLRNDTDEYYLSGGTLADIRIDDTVSYTSDSAIVGIDVTLGEDHCAAEYSGYAGVMINLRDALYAADYSFTTHGVYETDETEYPDRRANGYRAEGSVTNADRDGWDTWGRLTGLRLHPEKGGWTSHASPIGNPANDLRRL